MTDSPAIARLKRLTRCPCSDCGRERRMRGPSTRAAFACGAVFGVIRADQSDRIVAIARCRTASDFAAKLLNLECGVKP